VHLKVMYYITLLFIIVIQNWKSLNLKEFTFLFTVVSISFDFTCCSQYDRNQYGLILRDLSKIKVGRR